MSRQEIIRYWMEKADHDLASSMDNFRANRLANAVKDAYFACFHAFSSVLLRDRKAFKKHKEVRSVLPSVFDHGIRYLLTPESDPRRQAVGSSSIPERNASLDESENLLMPFSVVRG
jgi:hypothetical protein